jgi:hypothetical protein
VKSMRLRIRKYNEGMDELANVRYGGVHAKEAEL